MRAKMGRKRRAYRVSKMMAPCVLSSRNGRSLTSPPVHSLTSPASDGEKANRLTRKLRVKLTAFAAVSSKDSTIRNAAARCHLPVTTFYRHYRRQSAVAKPAPTCARGHPTALSKSEEELIVCTLLRYAHLGYHLERDDLLDCVEIIVSNMRRSRREKITFKNARPTVELARGFENATRSD